MKRKTNLTVLAFSVALILSVGSSALAQDAIPISACEELKNIGISGNYALTADIDCSGTLNVGGKPFGNGTFDGHHTGLSSGKKT